MANNKKSNRRRRSQKRAPRRRLQRYRGSATLAVTRSSSLVSFMRIVRTVLAALPVITGGNVVSLLGIFDVSFNFIKSIINAKTYYNGAYAMFKIRAGALMMNSPLMAKSSTNLSFPGYPISTRWMKIKIRNTTSNSERSGRWAAVFIPFREIHDDSHYRTILTSGTTFEEVSTMPYARVSDARSDLFINFNMRDKTMYCARPRELTESLGLILICWDTGSRDDFSGMLTNTMFNCEIELEAGCLPHPIFGPAHRVDYVPKDIDILSITDGSSTLVLDRDKGTRYLQSSNQIEDDFETLFLCNNCNK